MIKHRIIVTKEMQDKIAEEYNKRLEEKENETKDWRKKKMKQKIKEILLGTSIFWLPILRMLYSRINM